MSEINPYYYIYGLETLLVAFFYFIIYMNFKNMDKREKEAEKNKLKAKRSKKLATWASDTLLTPAVAVDWVWLTNALPIYVITIYIYWFFL